MQAVIAPVKMKFFLKMRLQIQNIFINPFREINQSAM